ncbi:MAG TPA: hypothetical protein ENK75_06410 [Saprospiraceae bacterium]|nr:hypothetical protein [Saprospiraceae bacterium]
MKIYNCILGCHHGKDKVYQSSVYKNPYNNRETEASDFKLGWSNLVASLRWNHLFGDKLFSNTTAYYSSYDYYADANKKTTYPNPEVNPNIEVALDYSSVIKDIAFKQDYQYFPNDRHLIRLGWSALHHHFEHGITIYKAETGRQTISRSIKDNEVNALESAIYIEDNFELEERLKINAGLHTSGFFINKRKYFSLQPRLSATYSLDSKTSFKLGYAKMAQYMHLLTSSNILQATDLWVPSTDKVRPQRSNQVSAGAGFLFSNSYQLEVDLYYKKMKNLIEYIDGASFLSTASYLWEEKVTSGKGTSKGLEVFFKKKTGKLTGWISYTLAWANRTFKDINFGKTYPFRYDRRHDVAIVGSYQLSKKWTLNASWVYNSGNAVTIPITAYAGPDYDGQTHYSGGIIPSNTTIDLNEYFTTNGIIENTVARNNYRLKPYHRMDITFSRTIYKKNSERIFTLGIVNVYNRLNPSFYQKSIVRDINSNQLKIKYTATTLFPIMPTISYRRSF